MAMLSDDQLNTLDKDTMAFIIKTLQGQLTLLETTNKKLVSQLESSEETTKKLMAQIDALTAQIRLSNQRTFGKKSEKADAIDGQMSLADSQAFC